MESREYQWARELCRCAGEDKIFFESFWNRLSKSELIMEEFSYYLNYQDFLCKVNICGLTLTDILIWQVDHFKAELDMGKYDMKYNSDKMILMAFDTLLNMEKDPEQYLEKFQSETGTDYLGKY